METKVATSMREPGKTESPPKSSTVGSALTKPDTTSTPAKAKITPTQSTRRAIKEETGIRSEPLVRLPSHKRKKARQVVNVLIGLIVFFLVGWGSYAIAKRIIQSEPDFNNTPPLQTDETTSEPSDQTLGQPVPSDLPTAQDESADTTDDNTTEEGADTTDTEPKPVTVTIKETETGYLNVRDGASTATPIITTVDPGGTFELLDTNEPSTWYKIKVDDSTAGWISVKYADKSE